MTELETWMAEKGETDDSLAPRIGVSRAHVSRLRRGKYRPSPERAQILEGITGIPAWNFLRPDAL